MKIMPVAFGFSVQKVAFKAQEAIGKVCLSEVKESDSQKGAGIEAILSKSKVVLQKAEIIKRIAQAK